jgi:hypothetical protein
MTLSLLAASKLSSLISNSVFAAAFGASAFSAGAAPAAAACGAAAAGAYAMGAAAASGMLRRFCCFKTISSVYLQHVNEINDLEEVEGPNLFSNFLDARTDLPADVNGRERRTERPQVDSDLSALRGAASQLGLAKRS